MNLNTFKASFNTDLKEATTVFFLKNEYILLGHKKRGFGQNKWNGVGGKVEIGESVEEAAVRETKEEIGISVAESKLNKVAVLKFFFPQFPIESNYNQKVTVFCVDWYQELSEPVESEEIYPKWFNIRELPFDLMWDDDKIWLPHILEGERITAEFLYLQNPKGYLRVEDFIINPLKTTL